MKKEKESLFLSPLFSEVISGEFIQRLNRFVVEVNLNGKNVLAHLPNPGRLWEILLPGAVVYLTQVAKGEGKIPYTLIGAKKGERVVFLHTQMANFIAKELIEEDLVPGLEGAQVEKREVRYGSHRFDFLIKHRERKLLLEVKSCTLFGKRVAMFPDAVTARGKEHILKLARLSESDMAGGILFVVSTDEVSFFSPDFHTDPAFAQALLASRNRLFVKAIGISWDENFILRRQVRELAIPWHIIENEAKDRGAYLLIIEIKSPTCAEIGSLGNFFLPSGCYVYVGSARQHLEKRVKRHLRFRKRAFWHVDYIRPYASHFFPIPIRTSHDLEHELASKLRELASIPIPKFGASDCDCPSHLFFFEGHPLKNHRFLQILEHYRIDYLSYLIK